MTLLFQLGNSKFAIPVAEVVEVAPWVRLDHVARAPEYVSGVFNYRGIQVPVIDLCRLVYGQSCRDSFTTRIILVHYPLRPGDERVLGLLAERVTETVCLSETEFTATGIEPVDAPYLGKAARSEHGIIERISVADLLPAAVQASLFPAETG
jgi:chemotaxis-related protein WspB